jgi:hypothetical protein
VCDDQGRVQRTVLICDRFGSPVSGFGFDDGNKPFHSHSPGGHLPQDANIHAGVDGGE